MRRKLKKVRTVAVESKYNSELLSRFINVVMWDGKKSVARTVVYDALDEIKKRMPDMEPLVVFETALTNISPTVEVRSRRVGGANYQVPREVRTERRRSLGIRWLIAAARSAKGKPMAIKLANEILAAFKNEGSAKKKQEDVHRMAESNRAFAHLAW